jgi:hypothetical protein
MDHVRIVVTLGDLSAKVWSAHPMADDATPICSAFSREGLATQLRDLYPAGYTAHYHPSTPPRTPPPRPPQRDPGHPTRTW